MTALPPTITDASVTLTWGAAGQYYGYCTRADVQFEFPDFTSYTTLTASNVGQVISYAAQELQDQLNLKITMPYVGADASILHTLRSINAKLATAELIDRFFQGAEPNLSPAGELRRTWAESIISDVLNGVIQWTGIFGDAVARAEVPLYPLSAGATIQPSPTDPDPATANPTFTMTRPMFSRDTII